MSRSASAELKEIFTHLLGVDVKDIDESATFLELGADSLLLLQVSQSVQRKFGVKIPFRSLLEEFLTPAELAQHLDSLLAVAEPAAVAAPALVLTAAAPLPGPASHPVRHPHLLPGPAASAAPVAPPDLAVGALQPRIQPAVPTSLAAAAWEDDGQGEPAVAGGPLTWLLEQQLRLMDQQLRVTSEQLALLRQAQPPAAAARAEVLLEPVVAAPRTAEAPRAAQALPPPLPAPEVAEASPAAWSSADGRLVPAPYVAHRPPQIKKPELSETQSRHLARLVARLDRKTAGSKRLTQRYRHVLADNRAAVGFRVLFKELQYPIFVDRAAGSRVWDIDGNEYVDVTMGFGTLILGHSPSFLFEALRKQSERGMGIGLEPPLAGETAQLFCELTGNERMAFVNDGTEAVMSAVRLARARTGRTKIAMFQGGYHGWFDEVMAISRKGRDGRRVTLPMAPGVSPHVAESVLVLDYCSQESIQILEGCAHELAAVIVDPQQTRRPGSFDTRDFLHDIRRLTEAAGAAMILDEVVTGFRVHIGGAQALYDVRADLVSYGKAVGAGLPIGVISGKAIYLDGMDGGMWDYGDGSYPQADQTFIQGSYFKHPFIIPAVWEVLNHYKRSGPRLQEELTARTGRLAAVLREHCERLELPIEVLQWGSICHFAFGPEVKYPSLFYHHLLTHDLYLRDGRPIFLSTAHSDEDVQQIVDAVKTTLGEMQEGGFMPRVSAETAALRKVRAVAPPGGEQAARRDHAPGAVVGVPAGAAPVADAEPARALALTASQLALWIATQMGEDAARAYHMSLAWRLRGKLDAAAFERAGQRVVDRHQALRTVFDADGKLQRFQPWMPFTVKRVDLRGVAAGRRQAQAQAAVHHFIWTAFDLGRGPLFRCALLSLGGGEHLAVLVFHHLVLDGWSFGVVLGEMCRAYAAETRGESCELPAVVPFGDYVRAQLRPYRDEDESYWLECFRGDLTAFEPPTDRPRPPLETFRGDRVERTLDAALAAELRRLGSGRGCTLLMTLLAGFQVFLHRLTGQRDLVVGVPAAGQLDFPAGSLVGYCLNILPLRSQLAGRRRFGDHLEETRRALLDALEHQAYPLARLIRRLGVPRDPSRAPLVGVLFNLEKAPALPSFGGLESELADLPVESAQFELNLNVVEGPELRLTLDYRSDLFDRSTPRRWLSALETLLRSAVRDPDARAGALALLSAAERQQVTREWNDTAAAYPQERCLHELFAAQAARTPDAVAVVQDQRRWSYRELDRQAERLANRLRVTGVGPEVVVGICLERSLELLAALLAVLKAGGAYLPLDPSFPAERLAFMLADSRAPWVLTEERWRPRLAGYGGSLLCLDAEDRGAPPAPASPAGVLPVRVGPENLAYVIYTSGSTGRPKGVQISQRNLINFLSSTGWPRLTASDVLLAVTTICFDIAGLELFLPLLAGARVVLASREVAADGDRLLALLASSGATVMQATPATWSLLLAAGWQDAPRIVVLCGGESLPPELAKQLLARGSALWNLYGPTETTVWSAAGRLADAPGPVSLGRPIANTTLRLLDAELEPVPSGAVGELYIGGQGVARGYLGRPDLTAERFVPDPLGELPGGRLYRTGDLTRHLADGRLEFRGRVDRQVKVRGLRIELEEIEAVLAEQPGVAAAAVVVHELRPGDRRLVAYVIRQEGASAETRETAAAAASWVEALRAGLRRRLPDYMLPTAFVRLAALPKTANGKLDRRALPPPETVAGEGAAAVGSPPQSGMEQTIAEIWREVLGRIEIGAEDNFFDLGGHSVLLIEVRQRLRLVCARELPLLDLFRHPSIRSLAAFLENPAGDAAAAETRDRSSARQVSQDLQGELRRQRRAAKAR